MKIGILSCDQFSVLGGAEKHIMDMARALDAEIVVPDYQEEVIRTYDPDRSVRFVTLHHPLPKEPWYQLAGMRLYKKLSLDYDFVICTDDMAVRYLVRDIPHLYCMFTPRRALYDMYYCFMDEKHGFKKLFYWGVLNTMKRIDRRFVKKHVKHFAANSHNVRNRIYKTYQRDADVIYAPVHTDRFHYLPGEGYWLSTGRIDKWKRIELQVEAFRQMPDKVLKIAGTVYPAYTDLVKNAPANVQFLGNISETELIDLYARAEGFITTAIDEDFGLTPVEAMASGKPVVATKEGGYLETVIDGYTGLLIAPEIEEIKRAVEDLSKNPAEFREMCQTRAKQFDYQLFRKSVKNVVKKCSGTGK
jgi:glycosyltransferase involved in cell wall biosynthesis